MRHLHVGLCWTVLWCGAMKSGLSLHRYTLFILQISKTSLLRSAVTLVSQQRGVQQRRELEASGLSNLNGSDDGPAGASATVSPAPLEGYVPPAVCCLCKNAVGSALRDVSVMGNMAPMVTAVLRTRSGSAWPVAECFRSVDDVLVCLCAVRVHRALCVTSAAAMRLC